MVYITRHDPFGDVLDNFLKGVFARPIAVAPSETVRRMRTDIVEEGGAYRITAELPGVRKDGIQVSIEGEQVSISAESGADRETKEGERVLHSERPVGKFARTFRLGEEIDEEKASARYADGVLELMLPKKAATGVRRITIQ